VGIRTYLNAVEFLGAVETYLSRDEARYGLILGLAKLLVEEPHRYGTDAPWFCTMGTGEETKAVAMRTPPNMVLVANFSGDIEAMAGELVTAVRRAFPKIPGVVGDKELGDAFARQWSQRCGTRIIDTMAQRVYRLDKVNDVPLAPGRFRAATMGEKDLVLRWAHAFHVDTGLAARRAPESNSIPVLKQGWIFFWERDGQPVSMAVKVRPTDKGMTVGGVYTPPELRGKGYATSCVAELSRNILESGKEFSMLYTDLANPTSNSIYMKIGYKPVCDSVQHTFG
jgi:predicted GNAT family acetyltransferase